MIGGLRDRLGDALFLRVAGPHGERHRDRIHLTPGPRWFDPASPIGRVHGDASMFIGGIRAILLQTLHPAAMTAVAEHSGYRGDMWGRLARTSRFIAVTTFGTADDAQRAVATVRAIHERVSGTMPDGTPYAASDPHLLLWVHVAEIDSFLLAHQTYGRRPARPGRSRRVRRPDRRDRPRASACSTRPRPRPSWPRCSRRSARSSGHRACPRRRRLPALGPELPLPLRPAYGVLMAAAIGLMPRWTRAPAAPPVDARHRRDGRPRPRPHRDPHHPLGDVATPSRARKSSRKGRLTRNSGMNDCSVTRDSCRNQLPVEEPPCSDVERYRPAHPRSHPDRPRPGVHAHRGGGYPSAEHHRAGQCRPHRRRRRQPEHAAGHQRRRQRGPVRLHRERHRERARLAGLRPQPHDRYHHRAAPRTGTSPTPASPATAARSSSTARAPTWSPATPTASATCSCTTSPRGRPPG